MQEVGFDKWYPSVNDATLVRHLNRHHRRRMNSPRFIKEMKRLAALRGVGINV